MKIRFVDFSLPGWSFDIEMDAVPRMGDRVHLERHSFGVTQVVWALDDEDGSPPPPHVVVGLSAGPST